MFPGVTTQRSHWYIPKLVWSLLLGALKLKQYFLKPKVRPVAIKRFVHVNLLGILLKCSGVQSE